MEVAPFGLNFNTMQLSKEEIKRYARHLNLPHFGMETQEKLKDSRVLVVGTGGLGAPLLQYLTAAGIGTIGVVDFDVVDTSNLQRQVLFGSSDVGKPKTSTAVYKLRDQNPNIQFINFDEKLVRENALDIIRDFDVVADGTDNFPTRYLVNDACVLLSKPYVYGSIFQFEGQVSVFNYLDKEGNRGPNYRDLFPTPPPPGLVPSCADGGVLGVLPGIIGSMQASEVIKVLTGIGDNLSGRLFIFDAFDFTSRTLKIRKDPSNPITGDAPTITQLIDYDEFCSLKSDTDTTSTINVETLKQWIDENANFKIIDVREPYERDAAHIGGAPIPMDDVEKSLSEIPKDRNVVVYCRSGVRSARVIELLQAKYDYQNLHNLEGGILAWKEKFDPELNVI